MKHSKPEKTVVEMHDRDGVYLFIRCNCGWKTPKHTLSGVDMALNNSHARDFVEALLWKDYYEHVAKEYIESERALDRLRNKLPIIEQIVDILEATGVGAQLPG